MVFGSPVQRKIPAGATRLQAVDYATDSFKRGAATGIADANVRLCLEPLCRRRPTLFQTAAEACEILDRIGHPNFVLHLDVKAMSSEAFYADPGVDQARMPPAPAISTPTTPIAAGPVSAPRIFIADLPRLAGNENTRAGCRSRCSITRPIRSRLRWREYSLHAQMQRAGSVSDGLREFIRR